MQGQILQIPPRQEATFGSMPSAFSLVLVLDTALLTFPHTRLHTPPAQLSFEAVDAPLIAGFLDHLEKARTLSVRSRNLRLTAFSISSSRSPGTIKHVLRLLKTMPDASEAVRRSRLPLYDEAMREAEVNASMAALRPPRMTGGQDGFPV
jgi:hypothetical protein